MTHHQEKHQSIEINPEMTGRLELADQDYKAVILSIFKDLKEKLIRISITNKEYQQRNRKYLFKEPKGNTTTKKENSCSSKIH